MFHSILNVFAKDCSFPKAFSLSYLVYGIIITGFFANFYIQSYLNKAASSDQNSEKSKKKSHQNGSVEQKKVK